MKCRRGMTASIAERIIKFAIKNDIEILDTFPPKQKNADAYGLPIDENGNAIFEIKVLPPIPEIFYNPEFKKSRKCNNAQRPKPRNKKKWKT